jgi:hypothetical protein
MIGTGRRRRPLVSLVITPPRPGSGLRPSSPMEEGSSDESTVDEESALDLVQSAV